MADRPILFSAPMVRALLEGRKTQTRRVLKPPYGTMQFTPGRGDNGWTPIHTKHFVGDRLWVRETWAHYQTVNHVRRGDGRAFDEVSDGLAGYRADGHDTIEDFRTHIRLMSGSDLEQVVINGDRWRSPIHMPRWASRLTLTVTDVRVQRLKDVSEEDAIAEGMIWSPPTEEDRQWWLSYNEDLGVDPEEIEGVWYAPGTRQGFGLKKEDRDRMKWGFNARHAFELTWNSIHGPDAWDKTPWVAALTFTVRKGNIDS